MSDTLPWDSDKPLSISQLLKQSMRSVDTIVKDGSLLDMMSTHLNGLLRQNRASEGDKSVMLFNNMFKQAENAMSSDSDKQVLNVLRRQVSSFIGITLGVKPFLDVQEQNQDQDDSSDDEDDRHKLSLSAARQNESDTAWNESKSYYDQNNVDIFTPERVESEKMRQQEEQLAREYNQRDDDNEEDEEEGDSSEYEEVVEEVQVKSREIGSREIGGGGEFKVVRRRQRKKKTQIETNFSYGGYHDNNRDDNSNNNNNSRPYYKQPPRHRVRITEFHPKYLERLNQDVFCMPLFFPSEESYGYFHSALASAQETLYVCVYSITDNDTADVLIDAKKRGVDVRVITDNDQMDACKGSDVVRLNEKFGIPFKNDDSQQFMHNKFAVMDNKTVITGSFNWSLGARYKNRENIVITNIPSVVRAYSKQFDELWRFY